MQPSSARLRLPSQEPSSMSHADKRLLTLILAALALAAILFAVITCDSPSTPTPNSQIDPAHDLIVLQDTTRDLIAALEQYKQAHGAYPPALPQLDPARFTTNSTTTTVGCGQLFYFRFDQGQSFVLKVPFVNDGKFYPTYYYPSDQQKWLTDT
jgi:hypothetical protein